MLKAITSYTFLLLLLASIFVQSFIIVQFEWNRAEIAELFCINKDEPASQCNGQCVLMKRLQQDKNNEKPPVQLVDNRLHTEWLVPTTLLVPTFWKNLTKTPRISHDSDTLNTTPYVDVPPPKKA